MYEFRYTTITCEEALQEEVLELKLQKKKLDRIIF